MRNSVLSLQGKKISHIFTLYHHGREHYIRVDKHHDLLNKISQET